MAVSYDATIQETIIVLSDSEREAYDGPKYSKSGSGLCGTSLGCCKTCQSSEGDKRCEESNLPAEMSVGASSNGFRGKLKSPKDFYRKKHSKSSCPILGCDGCYDHDQDKQVTNDRSSSFRSIGSVAARAQAWEKSTATAGYVTIGSVRYGVRFSASTDDNALPSRGTPANERDSDEADYCCDVMQMAWPRSRGSSLPPSKIPLPNADKLQPNNKRGKSTEERAAPVYRSTLEVSRSKKAPVGCFAVDSDESNSGDMKASPQTPNPARRPLFAKPNFKFGNASSGEGDTSRLISNSKEDLCGSGNQFQITLDKLHKFRFGGSGSASSSGGGGGGGSGGGSGGNDKGTSNACSKKKRSSDKTERLRELTDKLLHSRGTSAGTSDKKKPPPSNPSSPPSRFAGKQNPGSSLRNLFGSTTSLTNYSSRPSPKREASVQSVDACSAIEPGTPEPTSDECKARVNETKPESEGVATPHKPGSAISNYAQRLNAFRSASFSHVDYDATDGKYTRSARKTENASKALGCVTFPRVKQVDASTSVSPPPDKVTEKAGSTPSVDSAVGSDEGFAIGSSNNLALLPDAHKGTGSRSLTYPFTKKMSKSDEMPFSSIDGNGLKSLQHCPSLNRELSDVKEEVSVSSETPTIGDTLSECSNETVRDLQLDKTCDSSLSNSANGSPNPRISPNPDKTVYQCMVKEYPVQLAQGLLAPETPKLHSDNEALETLETLEREINELITQQKGNTSPKPEIYVTTWPKEPDLKDPGSTKPERTQTELILKCDNNPNSKAQDDAKTDNTKESEGDDAKRPNKRWSSDTSNDGSSEPISIDDSAVKRLSDKSKLVSQSSEEKEDDVVAPTYRRYQLLNRNDSMSEGDSDQGDRLPSTPLRDRERTCSPSPYTTPTYDLSDNESRNGRSTHGPRRYSKRPLRGPYGQMLEAEMKKPDTTRLLSKKQLTDDLKFLEEYMTPLPEGRPNPPDSNRPSSESRLTCPRPRFNAGRSFDDSQLHSSYATDPRSPSKRKASASLPFSGACPQKEGVVVFHQRTTSSPPQLEGFSSSSSSSDSKGSPQPSQELLAALLKGSSERRFVTEDNPLGNAHNSKDTRTHVVVELFDTEKSYVESLQIIARKYLRFLKSPENVGLVDAAVVDEIFYQIPSILNHHEILLEDLRKRLEHWDIRQRVGDIFLEVFTKPTVIETYTSFINNWKTAKEAIRITCQQRPAFARFLEAMTREHKGKLALDSLIIMPVQRIPRYELLIQRLLKHTESTHPDHALLLAAQHKIHELAVKINLTERETVEMEQQQQILKDLEALIEGLVDLTSSDRTFIRHDTVTMASGQGTRKERALFLFSDLLIITSIKRRSGTIRKPSATCSGTVASALDANKYKLLMRIPIDDLEVVKTKDENVKKMIKEIEKLSEDVCILTQISDLTMNLHCPKATLEDVVKEMLTNVNKQLTERQTSDTQLSYLELMLNTQHGMENISVVFSKPEKRTSWEESFAECKQKLALSVDRRPVPEFVASVPIRKTRAGLQFTCAAPTLGLNAFNFRDVWVCNSDGYVGQVCVLSLQPEPTVTSCNGVCNARILCIASIPAGVTRGGKRIQKKSEQEGESTTEEYKDESRTVELVSSSSSEEDEEDESKEYSVRRSKSEPLTPDPVAEETENQQSTMWLGTEDGNIHVYLSSDNIRIKKNKVKIQHCSSVQSIIYLDNRVFVSLSNGDIMVYVRDQGSAGGWNTSNPFTLTVGTPSSPITKMTPVDGRLWCGCQNTIKVLNTAALQVEQSFQVSSDATKVVTGMAVAGFGVWVSLHNSAIIRLFHSTSCENLCDVNVAPAVTKMLASCDDIIRQHKAACLRVTALLACKDLLWIGTSAGVVLTMAIPHVTSTTTKLTAVPNVIGVPHGHTGHVRFLTFVEAAALKSAEAHQPKQAPPRKLNAKSKTDHHQTGPGRILVISGGDGYEDFRNSNVSEVAGREDSTNHLLLWHV